MLRNHEICRLYNGNVIDCNREYKSTDYAIVSLTISFLTRILIIHNKQEKLDWVNCEGGKKKQCVQGRTNSGIRGAVPVKPHRTGLPRREPSVFRLAHRLPGVTKPRYFITLLMHQLGEVLFRFTRPIPNLGIYVLYIYPHNPATHPTTPLFKHSSIHLPFCTSASNYTSITHPLINLFVY